MLVAEVYHPPLWLSLGVIAAALAVSITASLRADKRDLATAVVEDTLPEHERASNL